MQSDDNGSGSLYFKWWASRGLPLSQLLFNRFTFLELAQVVWYTKRTTGDLCVLSIQTEL